MSEIKGQLLGIIIVLMVFGAVSAAMVVVFRNLTAKVEEQVENGISKATDSSSAESIYHLGDFISY